MFKDYNKALYKSGFTLAEVLLVITIIGIVAMQTIPTLVQNVKNQEATVGVKKAMSALSQVYNSFTADGITMDTIFAGVNDHAGAINQLCTKLNCIKNCGTGTGCFPDTIYIYLNGDVWTNLDTFNRGKAILADGSSIFVYDSGAIGCTSDTGDGLLDNNCGIVHFDVNGFKGPNKMGRDVFRFYINRNGIAPGGSNNDPFNDCDPNVIGAAGRGNGCASKVLIDGAVNY